MSGTIRGLVSRVAVVLDVRTAFGVVKEAIAAIPATAHQAAPADLTRRLSRRVHHQRRVANVSTINDQKSASRRRSRCERKVEVRHSSDVIHLQVGLLFN